MFKIRPIFIINVLFVVLVLSPVYAQEASSAVKDIRSDFSEFKGSLEVQMTDYDEVKFKRVYAEHRREQKKFNEIDFLYVKGAIKNLRNRHLSGATVTAEFINGEGQVVQVKIDSVTPRIIRLKGEKKGYFTVKIPYDPEIQICKLDISWTGKDEWYQ